MSLDNKNTLVLDSGLWEMKIGFAGDEAPRHLQKSIVGCPKNPAITVSSGHTDIFIGNDVYPHKEVLDLKSPVFENYEFDWSVIDKIWHNLFYNEVKSKLDDFALFVICSSQFDSKRKMKATEILFENFDFPSLYFQISNVTGLYSMGRTTGLVVDSGFSRTSGISIFEGYPVEEKKFESEWGGYSLNSSFKELIQKSIGEQKSGFKNQSDFFKFYGYNFNDLFYEEARFKGYAGMAKGQLDLTLPDGNLVSVSQYRMNEFVSESVTQLSELIYQSTLLCEEKFKPELLQNFCLIGGNALIPGIESQTLTELVKKGIKEIMIGNRTDEEKRFASWIGGSLFASLDCFSSLLIKRTEFEEFGADVLIKRNLL